MPLKVVAGGEKTVSSGRVYIGGVAKALRRVEVYTGSAWKLVKSFASPVTLAITPQVVAGLRNDEGYVTTNPATATPSGGVAPYTYAWSVISGYGVSFTAANSATSSFTRYQALGETYSADLSCTVTDAIGQTASALIAAHFTSHNNHQNPFD